MEDTNCESSAKLSMISVNEGGNAADCNGHSSPDSGVNDLSYERCGSSASSEPMSGDHVCQTPKRVEHRITVLADETIRIQLGDTLRHVSGPANIAMVASNGASTHLPIQAPPGHVVQRIVDENGVRYFLRPQHPNMSMNQGQMYPPYPGTGSPGMSMSAGGGSNHPRQQYNYNGTNGSQGSYAPSNSQQNYPAGYHPQYHHHIMHQQMVANGSSNGHGAEERAQQRPNHGNRHREKMSHAHRHKTPDIVVPHCYAQGHSARMNANGGSPRSSDRPLDSCSSSTDSHDTTEDEKRLLYERLSAIHPPQVEVESRRAVVHIIAPNIPDNLIPLDQPINTDVQFQLQYTDKKDGPYKIVYDGDATTIKMQDLKPATQYYIRLSAMLDDVTGNFTEPVLFETRCAPPDVPLPPKLCSRSKASISLKWNAAVDNGSKILHYVLEYSHGQQGTFNQCYQGPKKEYKLNKLQPAQCYTFRLCAVNSVGASEYSKELSVFTNGMAPEQPDPPRLSEATINSLLLNWIKRPGVDKEFVLQKEEEDTGHGFLPAYTGPEVSYKVDKLRKSTTYKFRLLAANDDGKSAWSQVVVYRTNADVPGAPIKLSVKGKILSTVFKLSWEAPREDGGVVVSTYTAQLDAGHGYQSVYEGVACECSCTNLLPGHTYRARVAARNSVGIGHWSEATHVTTKPACPGRCVTPWLVGKPRAHTLHLKWACPDNTGGSSVKLYAVQLVKMDNTTREVYRGRGTECTVAGLSPGRSYLLQVRAVNEAGEGEWSEPLEVISGAGHPEPPLAPVCQVKSAHSVIVSWQAPCNNGAKISEYRLDCLHPNHQEYSNVYSGGETQYEVRALQAFTAYTFRVQAVNSSGPSHHSETTTVTTLPSSPAVVHHVRPTSSATSITLTWAAPDDNGSEITHYNVEYGKHLIVPVTNVQDRECVLDDLEPDTTYRIRVQAVNGVGAGVFSSQVKVTTGSLPPPPPCLECVGSTWNSVRLKWSEVDRCEQYTVLMYRGQANSQCVYQGPLQQYRITKLHEHTDYQFTVSARNSAGEGEESSPLSITTARTPPHSLKAPAVDAVKEDGCEVSWQTAKHFPGGSIAYRLQMSQQSAPSDWKQVVETECTRHSLSSLTPGNSYSLRVCAVRVCSDQESIIGAYSPSVTFKTLKPQPVVEEVKVVEAQRPSALRATLGNLVEKLRLEKESQIVILVLLSMFVLSIVLAVVMAYYI